jgi:hypothetical protein
LGTSLAAYAGKRRDALGAGLGVAGLLLLTRGVTNTGFSHLLGFGSSQLQEGTNGSAAIAEKR